MAREWANKFWGNEAVIRTVVLKSLPKSQRGITKVYFVKSLGQTPARCLRSTGECWIGLDKWNLLPFEHKVFIILHENEHILQNTSDELAVDKAAHKKYMKMGYSLTESIKALTRVLSYTMPEHDERTREQMVRATVYDITVNKNNKLKNYLLKSKTKF